MHSEILELHVIYHGAPVLHLSQQNENIMLAAGRIVAQDALGIEATGENIVMEELENTYILYKRSGNFVVAMRCKKTVSRYGAEGLLKRVIKRLKESEEIIKIASGSQTEIKELKRDLEIILGKKLPVNPQEMVKIDQIIQYNFQKYPFYDLVGIATPEGRPVIVNYREQNIIPHAEYFWRDIVNLLHIQLGKQTNSIVTQDPQWLHIVQPFSYGEKEDWWAFIARIRISEAIKFFGASYEIIMSKVLHLVNKELVIPLKEIVIPMIRTELAQIGMEGAMADVLRFINSFDYPILRTKYVSADRSGRFTAEFQKDHKDFPMELDFLDTLVNLGTAIRTNNKQLIAKIMQTEELTWKLILDVSSALTFMRFMEEMAIFYAKEGYFDDYSMGRPYPFELGMGSVRRLKQNMDRIISMLNQKVPVELFFETDLKEEIPISIKRGIYVSKGNPPLSKYWFALIYLPIKKAALVLYKDIMNRYVGFLTLNNDFVELVKNRIDYIKDELTNQNEEE